MNSNLEEWIKGVNKKLDNHINEFVPRLTAVETNQKWLMKFFWAFMTPTIAALVYIIYKLQ